jgi:hypothetical protein
MFVYYRTLWKNRPAKFIENPALFIEFEESYIHTNKYLVAKSIKIYFNRKRFKNEIFIEEKKVIIYLFFISSVIKFNAYTFQSNDKLLCHRECFNIPRRYEMI